MKKMLARVLAILMVLNLGVFPTAYAVTEFPNPVINDTTVSETTFKFFSVSAGTLHYVVVGHEASSYLPTAADLKAQAIAGTKTLPVLAGGSVVVGAESQGSISITGLKKGMYRLLTTFETNGVLTAITQKDFAITFYELPPTLMEARPDALRFNYKLVGNGQLYYSVYTDATGVTASDALNGTGGVGFVTKGNTTATDVQSGFSIEGLEGNKAYDIVFVRKDMFENYSQVPYVLNDVMTVGNRLLSAAFTAGMESTGDEKIYLYFSEDLSNAGDSSAYTISFGNYTLTPSDILSIDNTSGSSVVINLSESFMSSLSGASFATGVMTVSVSPEGVSPNLIPGANTATMAITEGAMTSMNNQPMMVFAEYNSDSENGANGDSIVVTLDSNMSVASPSAVNFQIVFKNPGGTDLTLTPEYEDFTYEYLTDNSFKLTLTSGGALKVDNANLPSAPFMINYIPNDQNYKLSLQVPIVFGLRESSRIALSNLQLFGVPVAGFNPSTTEYNVSLPYIMFQNYPAAGLNAIFNGPCRDIEVFQSTTNEIMVTVTAPDGTYVAYYITIAPDFLTLGGIAINSKFVTNFDPFATSYTYTFTDIFAAAPTLLVSTAENVTQTITVAPHSSIANTYVYTIVLTKDGSSKTYTVTITGGASSNSGTTDRGDYYPGGGGGGSSVYGPITGGGSIPTPAEIAKFLDPASELAKFVLPPDLANMANLDYSLNFVKDAINSVLNEQQAIATLSNMDSLMKQVNTSFSTKPAEMAQVTQLMTSLTTGTEQKMALISNPEQQLAVLDKMMIEVQQFKLKVTAPTPELDKSVQELVQKTANNFGTLKISAPVTAEPVKLDTASLTALITKQTEAITKLNELQKAYFENGIAKPIKQELKIVAETPAGVSALKIELAPDQISTLKTAKVEALTVSNVNAEIKVPVINFGGSNAVQLVIEKMPQPAVAPQPGEPTLVYDMALMVNNEKQEKFSKPITLAFSLVTFSLEKESPNELAIFKKNEASGVWEPVGGIVDPEGGKIFVTRDNLSQYTVLKSKKSFSDADNSWAKAEINAMLNKGIVADSSKFNPQSALTRGEFAQWIAKAYGLKVSNASLPFKDVAKGGDEYAAIAAVYEQGLLSGKSKTNFDPKGAVTQNEMAAALGKLLVSFDNKAKSGKVTSKYLSQLKTTQVASWAEDDMALLMELGLNTSGGSGKDVVTKEAAAAAFMKFYRS